jgi:hypothetical protein
MALHVVVPAADTDRFNLYAAGAVLVKRREPGKHHFVFYSGTALILFYYFPHYRRAYIVCEAYRAPGMGERHLPNVQEGVAILGAFTSRRFDQLKNTVYYLEQHHEGFAFLPPPFFHRLAALIDGERNARPLIDRLVEEGRALDDTGTY